MASRAAPVTSKTKLSLVPPPNFSYFEETVCRCSLPVTKTNIPYLHSISIGCVVNLSKKDLDSALISYCGEQGVHIHTGLQNDEDFPPSSIKKFHEWIAQTIEIILLHSNSSLTTESYLDCVVLACLRRVQGWCFTAVLGELRHNVWPHKLFDYEQAIESFKKPLVDTTKNKPDYLAVHYAMSEKDKKFLSELTEKSRGDMSPSSPYYSIGICEEDPSSKQSQEVIEHKLYYSGGNNVLSAGEKYDPSISLIYDKDDDD